MAHARPQAEHMFSLGFLTAQEASDRAKVARTTILRWVEDGEVQGEQVGRYWYVKAESLADKLPIFRDRILRGIVLSAPSAKAR